MILNSFFSVSASYRHRKKVANPPTLLGPKMLEWPQILLGAYRSDIWSPLDIIYPNTTILILAGLWDETEGETAIQFRIGVYPFNATSNEDADFYTGTLVEHDGLDHVYSFDVTPDMVGKSIQYHVIATRNGITFEDYFGYSHIEPNVPVPVVAGWSPAPQPLARPGAPVGKTNYVWVNGATVTPVVITGEWYRNEVATGVTGETFPDVGAVNPLGRTTVEGDFIRWQEVCTNAASVSGTSPANSGFQTLISDIIPDLRDELRTQVIGRMVGKPGGATSMNLYSSVNTTTKAFVFNADNWFADLRYQLSAHHVRLKNNGYSANLGWTLITPRHLLSCQHSGAVRDNRLFYHLTHDNRVIESQTLMASWTRELAPGLGGFDLQVILLDKDLDAEGIYPLPILSMNDLQGARLFLDSEGDQVPIFGVTQTGITPVPYASFGNPKSDYTFPHERMLHVGVPRRFYPGFNLYPPEYAGFHYAPYSGDSGGALMIFAYGKFFLRGIHYDTNMTATPVSHGLNRTGLPALIELVDQKAVAAGLLAEPTGLTPTYVPIEDIESYPVPTPPASP